MIGEFVHNQGDDTTFLFKNITNYIKSNPTIEKFEIKISAYKEQRSLKQNAFFHGPLLDAFSRTTGETDRDSIKGTLKTMFLRAYLASGDYYTKDTRDLKVDEMREFIEKCKNYLVDELHGYLIAKEYEEYERLWR